jgi:hypothetical protein
VTAPNRTREVLAEMLRANTGRHFLDSGDAYGRHFERNQGRDFEAEERSVLSFKYDSITLVHRLYSWLADRLEFDEEADGLFQGAFREELDPEDDKSWAELREEFPAWYARWRSADDSADRCCSDAACELCGGCGTVLGDDSLYAATGIYGEGEPLTVNSYNEENLLEQTILFTYFELRSHPGRAGSLGSYVVLQIHGGCDVRGGYTRPRMFRVEHDDELAIFDFRRGTIFCAGPEKHWWTTDDGYHWYRDGACGRGAGAQLETYERVKVVARDEEPDAGETPEWVEGTLCVDEGGDGRCPVCGERLRGGSQ